MLADAGNTVAQAYGIDFAVPDYLQDTLNGLGIDVRANNGGVQCLPLPATYVVDRKGIVQYAFADEDFTVRAEIADVLAALKQL